MQMMVILMVNACMQNEGDLGYLYPTNVKMMVNLLLNMCIVSHMFMHHKSWDIYIQ